MEISNIKIIPYNDNFKNRIISIWEDSVKASHHFLTKSDIDYYKSIVVNIDFNLFQVHCSFLNGVITGFIGIADNKIEMLFISPEYFFQGHGKALMHFVIQELKANKVDVNEDNKVAVDFYKKLGFVIFDRTEKDSEGKDFPILKMRLAE